MGWNNVVDFIQDGFENIARIAGLSPSQMVKMGEPSPMLALETPRSFFSFYVDNFDQLTMVWRTDRGLYEGQPTSEQLLLREKMEELTVGRDPNKGWQLAGVQASLAIFKPWAAGRGVGPY